VPRRIEVGGGALIGTIIGAVVGHGKGAAIGAAVGAAGGAGAEVLTKGKQVSIPAETVLTFSLNNSVTLAPDEHRAQTGELAHRVLAWLRLGYATLSLEA
jgi:hypothetical protein